MVVIVSGVSSGEDESSTVVASDISTVKVDFSKVGDSGVTSGEDKSSTVVVIDSGTSTRGVVSFKGLIASGVSSVGVDSSTVVVSEVSTVGVDSATFLVSSVSSSNTSVILG